MSNSIVKPCRTLADLNRPRMYKTKLESWGYFKNYTEGRVRKFLHDKTARSAIEKVSKFGRNSEDQHAKKITKYLSRKKMTLPEFIGTGNLGQARADTISRTLSQAETPNSSDATLNQINSPLTGNGYEDDCPYRPWTKMFRLVEKFPR